MRKCNRCEQTDISQFYANPNSKDKLSTLCKTCCKASTKKAKMARIASKREEYKRADRNTQYKKNYGITLDQYEQKLKDQDSRCPLCKTHQSELPRRLAVDHNHDTGKIRGLLCGDCNRALGLFKDNPEICINAANYLLANT